MSAASGTPTSVLSGNGERRPALRGGEQSRDPIDLTPPARPRAPNVSASCRSPGSDSATRLTFTAIAGVRTRSNASATTLLIDAFPLVNSTIAGAHSAPSPAAAAITAGTNGVAGGR